MSSKFSTKDIMCKIKKVKGSIKKVSIERKVYSGEIYDCLHCSRKIPKTQVSRHYPRLPNGMRKLVLCVRCDNLFPSVKLDGNDAWADGSEVSHRPNVLTRLDDDELTAQRFSSSSNCHTEQELSRSSSTNSTESADSSFSGSLPSMDAFMLLNFEQEYSFYT